ncbi:Calcium-binding mitochondrial carrier protein [Venturia inaequalis]|nr:Calcium-binding mitochondrial carrier protein [Venturia inaequalis]
MSAMLQQQEDEDAQIEMPVRMNGPSSVDVSKLFFIYVDMEMLSIIIF